jgi:hypothetical protein
MAKHDHDVDIAGNQGLFITVDGLYNWGAHFAPPLSLKYNAKHWKKNGI